MTSATFAWMKPHTQSAGSPDDRAVEYERLAKLEAWPDPLPSWGMYVSRSAQ